MGLGKCFLRGGFTARTRIHYGNRQRRVDPDHRRELGVGGLTVDEAVGTGGVGGGEDPVPAGDDAGRLASVDLRGGEQGDAAVAVLVVVPAEEAAAVVPGFIAMEPNEAGKPGWYLTVLNWDSE